MKKNLNKRVSPVFSGGWKGLQALAIALCLILTSVSALADYELSYEGTVTALDTLQVSAPYGGQVKDLTVHKGDRIRKGQVLATLEASPVYAPLEGTVSGIYAEEGDDAESITDRYGAILYIEPLRKYKISANSDKAYTSSEARYIHLGETVYLSCTADGSHYGTGIVTALTDDGYTVEVTGGEFYMGEKVGIYRDSAYSKESSIGRGTVERTSPVAVKGSGSVLRLHVQNGNFVERGERLFETVNGTLDGLYSPDSGVVAPADGIVASVEASNHSSVNKDDAIIKMYATDNLLIEFNLPESDLGAVSEGDPVTIEFYWDNDESMTTTGTITSISHLGEAESESGSSSGKTVYKSYVTFTPGEDVRLGMSVTIYPTHPEEEHPAATEPEETPVPEETGTDPEGT